MDLSQEMIRQVILPTAAFYTPEPAQPPPTNPDVAVDSWPTSFLNPKNRVNSLDFPTNPSWRIDGCIAYGTQFYAIPLFLGPTQPHRVDVFIPNHSAITSPELSQALDLSVAYHTRDTIRLQNLGITRHVVRCLEHWTSTSKELRRYKRFPFGSRIIFHNLPVDVRDVKISIAPTYYLERQMLSVRQLESFWADEKRILLPPAIDVGELEYDAQPHDSVSIVKYAGRTLIFKGITSHTKYIYHELRQLLLIPPHPNIIQRPIISSPKVRDHLPHLALRGKITHCDEVKWALQLVRGLRHLRKTCNTFYSDMRLDNILLSDSYNLIMVDFEQRGVWSEFAAPEINAIECIRELAMDEELPDETKEKYAALLTRLLPNWEALVQGEEYTWPRGKNGYNVAWQCLREDEQESCEVYMLGRVLWCIFEAQSAPQRAAIWSSYKSEPVVEFPAYARTPVEMRRLIDWCTEGRQSTLGNLLVRSGSKLVLRELENTGGTTPEAVRETAKAFWTQRIADSEHWIGERIAMREANQPTQGFPNRPSLAVVESFIGAYSQKL